MFPGDCLNVYDGFDFLKAGLAVSLPHIWTNLLPAIQYSVLLLNAFPWDKCQLVFL